MTKYEIRFTKKAQKELNKLPRQVYIRILKTLETLCINPRAGSVRPMVGINSWRLGVGDYRVIYDIQDNELTILVIRIRHRKDVYKK